jgi:phage N-6-adenine-methyltransferase
VPSAGAIRQRWATPRELIEAIERRVGSLYLDVCAESHTAKAPRWYGPGSTVAENGLWAPWERNAWCNPPYGEIEPWAAQAIEQARENATLRVLLLVPPRTDQRWWHYLLNQPELAHCCALRPRVAFDAPAESVHARAPSFPVVIWEVTQQPRLLPRAWDWRDA